MSKYLFQGDYTEQGLKRMIKKDGASRLKAVEELVKGLGGKLEMFYFAHGSDDFIIVADVPDSALATAASLIFSASGAVRARTTTLITPEEIDRVNKLTVEYRLREQQEQAPYYLEGNPPPIPN